MYPFNYLIKKITYLLSFFINQQNKEPYPSGAHVYVIDLDDGREIGKKVYKIGKALDLEERLT